MKIRLLLNYCNMKTYKNFEEDLEKAKALYLHQQFKKIKL